MFKAYALRMETELEQIVKDKFNILMPLLDEYTKRIWAATEAKFIGRSGISLVSRATGLSRTTIYQGLKDMAQLDSPDTPHAHHRIRSKGGGRKTLESQMPDLREQLENLVEPSTRGDPESPLRWTCKSARQLAQELSKLGYPIGRQKLTELLADMDYSLQANVKTKEGSEHPDRDEQFRHINQVALDFMQSGQPVISIDTKKKELVGDFKNTGREWQPQGKPILVNAYDFPSQATGRANPYGVYDPHSNTGWVSVGTDHDTAEFAVESIRRWWCKMGKIRYPDAKRLLITADCGGSNGYRVRLWKIALQKLANETGLSISVCHFPPGTSKWNKIEHRMFSFISINWRGKPLVSHETIVNLIGGTTTAAGLTISAELDRNIYPIGIHVSDEELAKVNITRATFHGEWNYSISSNCSG